MKNENDISKIVSFAVTKYIDNPSQELMGFLTDSLNTAMELNCVCLDINTAYILLYIYSKDKTAFTPKIQGYLEALFYHTLEQIENERTERIKKAVIEINQKLEATNNIYNQI